MLASVVFKAAALVALFAAPVFGFGAPPAPQPSHTSCTYDCPTNDLGLYAIHGPSSGVEGNTLTCSYPALPLGPHDFNRDSTCAYDKTTGKLTRDNDSSFCHPTASSQCHYGRSYKRKDNLTAVLAKAEKRKAVGGPAVPESMKARHSRRGLSRL